MTTHTHTHIHTERLYLEHAKSTVCSALVLDATAEGAGGEDDRENNRYRERINARCSKMTQ